MAYDLDRAELNLLTPNIDPGARAAVIDYLLKNGAFQDDDDDRDNRGWHPGLGGGDDHGFSYGGHHADHDATVVVQEDFDGSNLDPNAQVLDLTTASNSVTTDAALKVIAENVATDAHLTVYGADNVMIVAGAGNDSIDLSDTKGDDVVLGGRGNDSITGGHGADSIYGGQGNDTINGGDGDHQMIVGGGGSDELHGGSGAYQLLVGGDGSDTLWGGSGAYDTVMGGNGRDEIHGGIGAHQLLFGGAGNDTMFGGIGDYDTVKGGNGNDQIHIADHANGHDTVDGGGGNDTLTMDDRSSHDLSQPIETSHGETVLHFTDGQTVTVSDVENIVFTDKTFHV